MLNYTWLWALVVMVPLWLRFLVRPTVSNMLLIFSFTALFYVVVSQSKIPGPPGPMGLMGLPGRDGICTCPEFSSLSREKMDRPMDCTGQMPLSRDCLGA